MSKKRIKKSDFPENGSFIRLTREMLKSLAWQHLSDKERLGYLNIKFNHFGDNAKNIICPRRRLINQMAPATWTKVINGLTKHGFIEIVQYSSGLGHFPNIYALSNEWKRWGKDSK